MSGLIASFSVMWTLILLLGVLALLEATLTLPGIAGLILTVGMSLMLMLLFLKELKKNCEMVNQLDPLLIQVMKEQLEQL